MKKTKKLLAILFVFLLAISLLTMVACEPPKDETPDETDTSDDGTLNGTLLVKNGTFYSANNSDKTTGWLKDTVTGWSKNSGATSYSSSTVDVKMGVVDLEKERFDNNKALFSEDLAYPGIAPNTKKDKDGKYEDTNALVVGLPQTEGSLYYRTSSAVTLTKNKYYRLSIDVWTSLFDKNNDLQGAYLYVTTGAYAEFIAIDTEAAWKTYEIYIEGNDYEDRSVYVELWLGHGPSYLGTTSDENKNPRLTKGVAFFDNVTLEEVTQSNYDAKVEEYGKEGNGEQVAVRSMKFADPNFIYESKYTSTSTVSSTTKPYYGTRVGTPNNYTLTVGKEDLEDSTDFPSYTGSSATVGIFDLAKFYTEEKDADGKTVYKDAYEAIQSGFHAPTRDAFTNTGNKAHLDSLKETEALLIYHPNYAVSGAGYKSNKALLIERDKYYTISVWVYVWVPEYGVKGPTAISRPDRDLPDEPAEDASDDDKKAYNDLKELWDKYNAYLAEQEDYDNDKATYDSYKEDPENSRASATFKLTGVSVDNDNLIRRSTGIDTWQQLTFTVKGNELSDRQVFLEFWYGEGNWGEDTLMAGGAIFDNIEITVEDDVDNPAEYVTVSPLTEGELNEYGLLTAPTDDFTEIPMNDEDGKWTYAFEDKKSDPKNSLAGILSGTVALDADKFATVDELKGLSAPLTLEATLNNVKTPFNILTIYNREYSAVKMTSDTVHTIAANCFYRLSIWVRTEGLDEGKGLSVALLNKEDDSSMTSFSNVNTESNGSNQWVEYIFYLRGAATKDTEAYFQLTLGTGDVFTPDNHLKGAAYLTAITWKNIEYKEFKEASSSDYVKTYTVSASSVSDSVTNGYFLNLDTSNYEATEENKPFDEAGKLVGVAKPSSWSATDATSALNRPASLSIKEGKLTWKEVPGADQYYVYMDGVRADDGVGGTKTENDVLVGVTTEPEMPIEYQAEGNFKVRAVKWNDTDKSTWNPATNRDFMVSDFSTTLKNTVTTGEKNRPVLSDLEPTAKMGVIDYKNLKKEDYEKYFDLDGDNRTDMYPGTEGEGVSFVSPNNNLLMIHSDYKTRMGFTMSSTQSLSSNSYYELGVWVKTMKGAKASVTISNSSNVFARTIYEGEDYDTEGDYVGYVNIDTEGKWVFYKFYIKTTINSASLKLELFLGNKYAVTKDEMKGGMSSGTVLFDDVSFKKLDSESDYNDMVYGSEEPTEDEIAAVQENVIADMYRPSAGVFYNNQTVFKLLDYTADSFDVSSEVTKEGQGNTPGDYSHYVATDGTDYSEDDDKKAMVYGVYDKRKIGDTLLNVFTEGDINSDEWMKDFTKEELASYLTTDMGNNFLMMANLKANGQYYLSSTSITLNSESYYKITFLAKAWVPEGKYAEFRFEYGDTSEDDWKSIRISEKEYKEYTLYLYNENTSAISSNKLSFYLGSNDKKQENGDPENFFKGLLLVDHVSVTKLDGKEEYEAAAEAYDALSDDDKAAASTAVQKFEKKESTDGNDGSDEEGKTPTGNGVNAQTWLLIASIVIGVVLIATVAVFGWRKLKKRFKKKPAKVKNVVPVNMEEKLPEKTNVRKKDLDIDDDLD